MSAAAVSAWYEPLLDRDLVPDTVIRAAIRGLIHQRLEDEARTDRTAFLESLKTGPIALHPDAANQQHYEVPPAFFELVLGPALKYSCCHWPAGVKTLAEAEQSMLALTVERAGIQDGDSVLDLGCGWGSLSLYLARRFPNCQITAVSNSRLQRQFIESRHFPNVHVTTADRAHRES